MTGGMGFRGQFARQQSRAAHVRFGSLADISCYADRCPLYPRKRTSGNAEPPARELLAHAIKA